MAQTKPVNSLNLPEVQDYESLPGFHRLGFIYGALIGLGIALGFWGLKISLLARLPLVYPYGGAIISSVAVILLCGFTGWLTSRMRQTILAMLIWLGTAVLVCIALGYLPIAGQNVAVWLIDQRFASQLIVQAPTHLFWWHYVISGFLLIIFLTLMPVLQNFNLTQSYQEIVNGRRVNIQAILPLLIPALLIGLVSAFFPDLSGSAPRSALEITDQAIQRVRNFEGDLFQLSTDSGFNYNALASVSDQLDGPYKLNITAIDDNWSSAMVTALFDSGAWVNCRVNINQQRATYLSFCFDAATPVAEGLNHLLNHLQNSAVPTNSCPNCEITADDELQPWLKERASQLGENRSWQNLVQHGRIAFIQATNRDTGYSITCRLDGLETENVELVLCEEATE